MHKDSCLLHAGSPSEISNTAVHHTSVVIGINASLAYPPKGQVLSFAYPDGTVQTKLLKTSGEETTTAPDGTLTTVLEGPDPRSGMHAPVAATVSVRLPSGRISQITTVRTATQSNPNDPFTFTHLTENVSVNGKTSTSAFNKATLTDTNTSPAGRMSATTVNDKHRPVTSQVTGLNAVNDTCDTRGRLNLIEQGADPDQRTTLVGYNKSDVYQREPRIRWFRISIE